MFKRFSRSFILVAFFLFDASAFAQVMKCKIKPRSRFSTYLQNPSEKAPAHLQDLVSSFQSAAVSGMSEAFLQAYLEVGQFAYGIMELTPESVSQAIEVYNEQLAYTEKQIAELREQPESSERSRDKMLEKLREQAQQYKQNIRTLQKQYDELTKVGGSRKTVSDEDREKIQKEISDTVASLKRRKGFVDCGLTDTEIFVIYLYTDALYIPLNHALRSGDPANLKKFETLTQILNEGLSKLATYDQTVRRGASLSARDITEFCEGCVVTMKAFTSTSASQDYGGSHHFMIKARTGAYIAPLSKNKGEDEVLFRTGTKFKVLKADGTQFFLEEVP